MLSLEDFRNIVPDEVLAKIHLKARKLYGKRVIHINSTFQGGGVAEILSPLVLLMNDIGIETGWRILHGNPDFFGITKKFHNALQGGEINLTEEKKKLYLKINENFSYFTRLDHDCVIIHDPQPLAMVKFYKKTQPWIWRCHIDLTEPNVELWDFLKTFLLKYDQIVFSSEKYLKADLPVEQRLIPPAINPLSIKNMDLTDKTIRKYLEKADIPTDKPIISQISRMDSWKDPEGVLNVFEQVRKKVDCRLVFCYNLASDDPEGLHIYNKIHKKAKPLVKSGHVVFAIGNNEILVNSIQQISSVIIQKSIREGFCLAVTESLWKAKPVVASNVGGIPLQIEDGKTGFLLDPKDEDGFAEKITYLLQNPKQAEQMGKLAKETIRQKFLITRLLSDYLDMLSDILKI